MSPSLERVSPAPPAGLCTIIHSDFVLLFCSYAQNTTSQDSSNTKCLMPNVSFHFFATSTPLYFSIPVKLLRSDLYGIKRYRSTSGVTFRHVSVRLLCLHPQPVQRPSLVYWSSTVRLTLWRFWRFSITIRSGYPVSKLSFCLPISPCRFNHVIECFSWCCQWSVTCCCCVSDGSNPYTLKLCFSTSSHLWAGATRSPAPLLRFLSSLFFHL